MTSRGALGEVLSNLFDRRPFVRRSIDDRPLPELCAALLAQKAEETSRKVAAALLDRYRAMDDAGRAEVFTHLNEALDIDAARVAELAAAYGADPTPAAYQALTEAAEAPRRALFRRLNQAPGGTAGIVHMRADLLKLLPSRPELARTDHDLVHLLRSWFNRGFLVLRQITWDSPASILEKIIAYEAVHEIGTWDDLRRRLHPADRRLFAFFHPAMPDEPLIFVEVALTRGVPGAIRELLTDRHEAQEAEDADTAVFYSISNCQAGLQGISFGNSLIKQVVADLGRELPGLRSFVTLSPIPGLVRWLAEEGLEAAARRDPQELKRLAARFLVDVRDAEGRPRDPVARFHLGNGALVHAVHLDADRSETGMARSLGVMVNYRYDPARIPANLLRHAEGRAVAAAPPVRALARQAARGLPAAGA